MESKVVVLIGATSGIGRAAALLFAENKHSLVLACRDEAQLHALADECEAKGARAIAVRCDIGDEADVTALAGQAIATFGRIDVWINDAAVAVYGAFEEVPSRHARRVLDVNVMGYIYGSKAALQHFKSRRKGILINVASISGLLGQPFSSYYAMSKSAVRGLCLSLQPELADDKDIHVCCVLPATMDTPFFQHAANLMGKKLQALTPAFDPHRVARMFLKLVDRPKPEVFVGMNPLVLIGIRILFPHFFERSYKRYITKYQFQNQSAAPTDGNLFGPMSEWSDQVTGGWSRGSCL